VPIPQYVAALKAMQQAPTDTNADALVSMLEQEPELARAARPVLVRDATFAPAFRVLQAGADYEYHNTPIPMPRAIKSPTSLDTLPVLKGTPNASETLDRYATYMMDTWGARPHWGQQNPMNKARFQRVYADAVKRFLPAYRALTPNGFFDGPLAQQLGSRDLAHVS
jgi:hypothetical protein